MADQRDAKSWVVVEITSYGEAKILKGELESTLRRDLGVDSSFSIFVPVQTHTRNGKRYTTQLLEGYVFLESSLSEVEYYRLERQPYVEHVVSSSGGQGMRVLSTVTNEEIERMRKSLIEHVVSDLEIGMHVTVLEGIFQHMDGKVVSIDKDHASVFFELKSRSVVSHLPKVFLEPM